MASFSYDFNRTDGALSSSPSSWPVPTGLISTNVAGNQLVTTATLNSFAINRYPTPCDGLNQYVRATFAAVPTAGAVGVNLRGSTTNGSGYSLTYETGGEIYIARVNTSGTPSGGGAGYYLVGVTPSPGDVFELQAQVDGTTVRLSVLRNGTKLTSFGSKSEWATASLDGGDVVDSSPLTGLYAGVDTYRYATSAGALDDWYGGDAPAIEGSGAIALDALTVSGTGVRQANGAGAISLLPLEVSGSGERQIPGSGAIELPALQVSGDGSVGALVEGSGTIELLPLEVSGAGARGANGAGAITLDPLTVAGAGARGANGSGAIGLEALQVAGAGFRTAVGTGDIQLLPIEVAGSGAVGRTGSGAITLEVLQLAGDGSVFSGIGGAGAFALEALEVSGDGFRTAVGAGDIQLGALLVSGAGDVTEAMEGSGALTLEPLVVSGSGKRALSGSGAIVLGAFRVSGYDIEPEPDVYTWVCGTAVDANGRMVTVPLAEGEPLPAGARYIDGLPHDASGARYITPGPTDHYICGLAVRADGVQVVSGGPVAGAVSGIPTDAAGRTAVEEYLPVRWVEGFGIGADGLLSVTDKG